MGLFKKREKENKIRIIDKNGSVYDLELTENYLLKRNIETKEVVRKINIEEIEKIYEDKSIEEEIKDKSVIKRAIIGGVLTGGVGAIVGGMTGIGTKTKKKLIPVVRILFKNDDLETYKIYRICTYKKVEDINKLI